MRRRRCGALHAYRVSGLNVHGGAAPAQPVGQRGRRLGRLCARAGAARYMHLGFRALTCMAEQRLRSLWGSVAAAWDACAPAPVRRAIGI